MQQPENPSKVRMVVIHVADDETFEEQAAAYALAERLVSEGYTVRVDIAPAAGCQIRSVSTPTHTDALSA